MAFKNWITALVALAATTTALAQTDLAQCDFVFIPDVPVDPASTNVVADFNFIPGFALADASDSHSGFTQGATFTENPDDVFNVHNAFSEDGLTCQQTADFLDGLAGQTLPGPSGINWTLQSVDCSCVN